MYLRAAGSTPVVGSSINTRLGLPIKEIAILNRRLFPPLYVPLGCFEQRFNSKKMNIFKKFKFIIFFFFNIYSIFLSNLQLQWIQDFLVHLGVMQIVLNDLQNSMN